MDNQLKVKNSFSYLLVHMVYEPVWITRGRGGRGQFYGKSIEQFFIKSHHSGLRIPINRIYILYDTKEFIQY